VEEATVSHPDSPNRSRRTLLRIVVAAGSAALVGLRPDFAPAQPATGTKPGGALPHLAESDPLAKSLGYTDDVGKVDKTKYPNYKPGQKCASCNFFQGTAGQQYGPCQIFPGKAVNANGWCASYAAKA
jgi:hypothetical protein